MLIPIHTFKRSRFEKHVRTLDQRMTPTLKSLSIKMNEDRRYFLGYQL